MAASNDLNIETAGYVVFDGVSQFTGRTFQAGTGITLTNASGVSGNTTITANGANDLHTALYIVSSAGTTGTGANFTTISAAIAAAQGSGINSTIFIMPGNSGTYTENFTLPANINLVGHNGDQTTPNVTIIGTITCTSAGSRAISNLRLQTNSAALLAVTGNAATVVNLNNCYLNCTNNTGITFSSSSGSSQINLLQCAGNLGTTGIGLFTHTSSGTMFNYNSRYLNSGASTTASTCSAGGLSFNNSEMNSPVTMSSTSASTWQYSNFVTSPQNVTSVTLNGASHSCKWCRFESGSASAISIGSSVTEIELCTISSSNTNAITGAGTLSYADLIFLGTSSTMNVTTQVGLVSQAGIVRNSKQPSFLATANAQAAVTGDSTNYTILYANEIFDQNSNFSSPTFTAPFTGRYQFNVTTALTGLGVANVSGNVFLVATSRTVILNSFNWGNVMNSSNVARVCGSVLLDMTAGDTCIVTVTLNGGAKVVGIGGTDTTFSGFLVG